MKTSYVPPQPGDPNWIDPEKVRSVAMGSPGSGRRDVTGRIAATERRWDRDIDAYVRLRRDGLQPSTVDGASRLEASL